MHQPSFFLASMKVISKLQSLLNILAMFFSLAVFLIHVFIFGCENEAKVNKKLRCFYANLR